GRRRIAALGPVEPLVVPPRDRRHVAGQQDRGPLATGVPLPILAGERTRQPGERVDPFLVKPQDFFLWDLGHAGIMPARTLALRRGGVSRASGRTARSADDLQVLQQPASAVADQ